MTEDEMVGWHHQLNGHEFEQALGDGEGQGSLACCSPWICSFGYNRETQWKRLKTSEGLNPSSRALKMEKGDRKPRCVGGF